GAGQFAVPGTSATGAFKNANLLAGVGDWNRDGRSDVLMREASTGYLWLVPGRGRGTFGPRLLLNKYGKNFSRLGAIGDVSGDGRPDLAGMHTNGYLYIARSTSVVRPSGFVKSRYLGDGYDEVVGADRDLSGDGVGDLVIRAKETGALKILVGKRDGGFGRALGPFPSDAGYRSLSGGQVMGSAHPDLVAVNKAGTALVVMAHNGQVNLRPVLKGNLSRTDIGSVYNVGDWNGDGKGDVITRQASGDSLVLRRGRGDGTFAAGSHLSQGGWKTFTYLAAVGDVTGDGDPDLIGRTRTGIATIFPGNGAKGFEAPILTPWDMRSFNQIGSGVWKTRMFLQSAYLSTGGSFVPSLASGAGDLKSYDWVLGPGDLDGDGRSDLVARDAAGQLWLLPGTKTGHGTRRFIASGFGGYAAAG
ncbi:MAG TPA: VCBS repeat-containing protein, partial [Microlunatus sp.]|nr:VCBS repeat-containing protein [Microlunatus sp.]